MSQENESAKSKLLDIYDELALDLDALQAMAWLIGEHNGSIE